MDDRSTSDVDHSRRCLGANARQQRLERGQALFLFGFLPRNFSTLAASLRQSDCDGLLAALHSFS
jgi:hypothetical protein